tara:strand:+ start:1281 stop:1463 length:183 start_codon:yes stop_codon:yes gene_type:complete
MIGCTCVNSQNFKQERIRQAVNNGEKIGVIFMEEDLTGKDLYRRLQLQADIDEARGEEDV